MRNARSKTANARYVPERTARREFPKGAKGVVFCGTCNIAYYKKAWHHNLRHFKSFEKDVPVVFRLCPACTMIKNKQFEGRVTLLYVPAKYQQEVERLVRAYGERAYQRDPLDRVIGIKKMKDGFEVTTTENQLAQKLARKVQETFKTARPSISHSASPSDVAFITVTFS
ncbi:MAG: NMD3-related protein [bacterium]|nr:NMD3-related protein [bacterium]